jgi:hypothetical protein
MNAHSRNYFLSRAANQEAKLLIGILKSRESLLALRTDGRRRLVSDSPDQGINDVYLDVHHFDRNQRLRVQ